ncbi:MAG: hypothetical protein WBC05_21750 [Sedimentisphaerales bacterium]
MEAERQIPARFTECDLKKQSQFSKGQNGVKTVIVTAYGIYSGWMRPKNKANQTQYAGHWPETRSTP